MMNRSQITQRADNNTVKAVGPENEVMMFYTEASAFKLHAYPDKHINCLLVPSIRWGMDVTTCLLGDSETLTPDKKWASWIKHQAGYQGHKSGCLIGEI